MWVCRDRHQGFAVTLKYKHQLTGQTHCILVSVHRAPHLLCYRALEVQQVRLCARCLASAAPCKRLQFGSLQHIYRFNPVNGYVFCIIKCPAHMFTKEQPEKYDMLQNEVELFPLPHELRPQDDF